MRHAPSDISVLLFHASGTDDRNINFQVRREVVSQVLIWLKHNTLYESTNIGMNHVEQLPEEGYLNVTSASFIRTCYCGIEEDQ